MGANLSYSTLTGVQLRWIWLKPEPNDGPVSLDLTGAFLGGANLSGLDLSAAKLDGVHWTGNTPWNAPPEGPFLHGPRSEARLTSLQVQFGDSDTVVGAPCMEGTRFPVGFQVPVASDCSQWSK